MKSNNKFSNLRQTGFTLVELMVGLTIGLLATIIIMQVFSNFETQKRSTTGTADAQTNGNIALYNIQREMEMAGYPLAPGGLPSVPDSPLECTTLTIGSTSISGISPVSILDGSITGASGASDSVTIRYGNSDKGGVPSAITGNPTANSVTLGSTFGCQPGDNTIIVNGPSCAMSTVTAVAASGSGVTPSLTLLDTTGIAVGSTVTLACLGTWQEITYAVNNGNLERKVGAASSVPVVEGIVSLQAQYGISAVATSNYITQWVDATGGTWSAPTASNRNRIKAIRIAVIARNAKPEITQVSTSCGSTTPAGAAPVCTWVGSVTSPAPGVDLSINGPTGTFNWQNYRYRVFETIIPLRNQIWYKSTL